MRIASIALAVLVAGVALAQDPAPAAGLPASAWPRAIAVSGGSVEIFQPQIESFRGDQLAARAAVAWTPTGRPPAFGVVWVESRVSIDKVAGTVALQDPRVTRVRFATLSKEQEQQGRAILEREIPTWNLDLSVLELEASIAVNEQEMQASEALDFTPPRMVFSQEPAVLLLYEGTPIEQPVEGSALRRVVNTPMLVLFDPATRRYYLSGGKFWYEAPAATGPFSPLALPSPAVQAFFDRNPPPPIELEGDPAEQAAEKAVIEPATPPRIVVATEPTELFVFDGAPQYRPVGDEAYLLYVANTESHVLVDVMSGETYVLASGRWFRAPSLDGPWVNVPPDELPGPFRDIPADSDIGDVRTFVAGTDEATDAVADSFIPQTAEIRRDQTFEPAYDGPPRFERIEGTDLSYAVNTPDAVVLDAGRYWACDQGVWYTGDTPQGQMIVADRRPPHIDQVPPTVHIYHTRYVFVYRSTPQVVFVGHTPGFVGVYRHRGVVVFGTGFVYRPWVGPTVFFARPATFGVRVVYNPWTGFGFVVSPATPFITVGIHFHPVWGPRPRPPGWWGPVVYRPVFIVPPTRHGWHRPPPVARPPAPPQRPQSPSARPPPAATRPGVPVGQRPGTNIYDRPQNRPRNADRPVAQAPRPTPQPVDRPNNVFGDRAGNVYRQNDRGNWERNTRQGWEPQRPAPAPAPGNANRATPAPAPGNANRPAATPGTGQRPPPQGQRPPPQGQGQPNRQANRQAPPQGQNRGPAAPAGLGPDAAARQRSAPQPARTAPGGAGAPRR